MGLFTNIKERVALEDKARVERPKISLKDVASGEALGREWLQRQIPFILFLVMIALFYINNRFTYEAQLRDIDRLKKELIDAKYESLTVSEELMQMSRQSYVIDKLREQGSDLEVSTEPAVVINR
ncbi:MAG: hypothetical protein H6543_02275 [Prevotellaceae bacterium]|nr:hypothetical protein [Prevotellaceae bacterium]